MPSKIQLLIDIVYRHPIARIKKTARFGGYLSCFRMIRSRVQMKKAAGYLKPVNSYPDGLPVYFLTGKKYLYQTLFCIASLRRHSREKFNFILIDDGTMDNALIALIKKQLPGATVFTDREIQANLAKVLPAELYPVLNHKRHEYPHIKKLTDIHTLPGNDWKLVLDSDMLFWNDPLDITDWLKRPLRPLHMIDCVESYGYSRDLMERLAGAKVPSLLNVGAIGLESAAIDWNKIESWITQLEEKENKSYYLEQAITAMLLGEKICLVLPAETYIVNPEVGSAFAGSGTLLHYVDLSKKEYFNSAWRTFGV